MVLSDGFARIFIHYPLLLEDYLNGFLLCPDPGWETIPAGSVGGREGNLGGGHSNYFF